jgi:pimeloyl-ACP methyl ester carboxylesterase
MIDRSPDGSRPAAPRESGPPASIAPPGETHAYAIGADGTRLFVRSKERTPRVLSTEEAPLPGRALRAFLCDGVLCDGFIWKYAWDDVAEAVALTHWHYRGHGRSARPKDPDRIDIAAHADDLWKVRELMGDPPSVLFGHSMGCQVALENYRFHPENVRGLVLLCGSAGKVTSTFHNGPILELILPKLVEVAEKNPELVRAVWSRIPPEMALRFALRMGEVDPARTRPEDFMPYLQHMTHVDFPMFLRMVRAAGEHTAEDLLPHIRVPTLIVAGERDTFTPAYLAEAMQKQIPGAELLVLEGGSHVAPLEQHELVRERVLRFLEERVGASG